jgi:DNA-directed RNA polymerase subunit RPC12/RpoP
MIEIEKFPCTDSQEARKRERYWMETLHATLNCRTPSRSRSEYILDNREQIAEYQKIYKEANKEQLVEQRKIYNEANKEQIAEYQKIYNEANREQIAENQKIYNLTRKEHRHEKFNCPCGGKYLLKNKTQHFKTKKHSEYN